MDPGWGDKGKVGTESRRCCYRCDAARWQCQRCNKYPMNTPESRGRRLSLTDSPGDRTSVDYTKRYVPGVPAANGWGPPLRG